MPDNTKSCAIHGLDNVLCCLRLNVNTKDARRYSRVGMDWRTLRLGNKTMSPPKLAHGWMRLVDNEECLLSSQDSEGFSLLYILSRHYRGNAFIACEMSGGKLVVAHILMFSLTVHHSIELFPLPTLMHNSLIH